MSIEKVSDNLRPKPDQVLIDLAAYVMDTTVGSTEAYSTSRLCLMDALGCAMSSSTGRRKGKVAA